MDSACNLRGSTGFSIDHVGERSDYADASTSRLCSATFTVGRLRGIVAKPRAESGGAGPLGTPWNRSVLGQSTIDADVQRWQVNDRNKLGYGPVHTYSRNTANSVSGFSSIAGLHLGMLPSKRGRPRYLDAV
jgi:hypothetical protein